MLVGSITKNELLKLKAERLLVNDIDEDDDMPVKAKDPNTGGFQQISDRIVERFSDDEEDSFSGESSDRSTI